MADWFRTQAKGVDLFVRLTPRSGLDAIGGPETSADGRSHLGVRVRAVPEKGAANVALERLLADSLDVPRSKVSVAAGHTARLKTVRIEGAPEELAQRLRTLFGTARPG